MEVTRDDMEIVSALRAALADKVGKERFELWFGPGTWFRLDQRALTVGVPNRFFRDWIRSNFRRQIESACLEALGNCPSVKYIVDDALAAAADAAGPPLQPPAGSDALATAASRGVDPRGCVRRPPAVMNRANRFPPGGENSPPSRPSSPDRATAWPSSPPKWSRSTPGGSRRC